MLLRNLSYNNPDGSPTVPWVWESILVKLKQADIPLLSSLDYRNKAGDGE